MDRLGSIATAIMAPSRRSPHITELVPPGCGPDILRDADPLVEDAPQQVEAAELLDDSITNPFAVDLGSKGAEYLVPDNEGAGIVFVEITRVCRMVDSVVRRRVHHCFEPARKASYCLGMDPELVNQVKRANEEDHRRMKPDKRERDTEDEAERNKASPCLAERSGQVVMLARVMVDMARPEPPDSVAGAVCPVISEVVEHEAQYKRPPSPADIEQALFVEPQRQPENKGTAQQPSGLAAGAESERAERIFRFVFFRRFRPRP